MSNNGAATRFCNDIVGPTAFEKLAIIGGGAWGTALALTARRAGRHVTLQAFENGPRIRNPAQRRLEVMPR